MKPRKAVGQGRPFSRPKRRIFPLGGSMRATPPGFSTAHMAPSEVSPSHRTLSPPKPSFRVQVRSDPRSSMRARPREVPTQSAPFRSRRMLQIRSDGRPCALVHASHSP